MENFDTQTQSIIIFLSLFLILVTTRYISNIAVKADEWNDLVLLLKSKTHGILEENPHMTELARKVPNYDNIEEVREFIEYLRHTVDAQVFSQLDTCTIIDIINAFDAFKG